MKIAVISLSNEGAVVARRLAKELPGAKVFLHESVRKASRTTRFRSIVALTYEIFDQYDGMVYATPCGVAVRVLAPNLRHKTTDPAVVVVDVGGRYAVSLLSGHEGGANELAVRVANILGAEPIITTTTEALKTVIVGIGCRRGTPAAKIVRAVRRALKEAKVELSQVRLLASADIKADEPGLKAAAQMLGVPLRFIPSEDIRSTPRAFERSEFVAKKVNLPAVAEPCALLAGRRTQLLLPKRALNGVTVALARESCLWSGSAPAGGSTARAARSRPSPRARSWSGTTDTWTSSRT